MNTFRVERVGMSMLLVFGLVVALTPALAGPLPVVPNAAKDPREVPPPITRMNPTTVTVNLAAKEVVAGIAPGKKFWFWTFAECAGRCLTDGSNAGKATVPGPLIRVMEGDTLVINLTNLMFSEEPHNIDFHAAMGPGGGAAVTNVEPGETKTLTFKAKRAGAYIYHCAGEGMPWEHVSHGMYGMIMVEPVGGLPRVDKEFYVGQSDWYLELLTPANRHYVPIGYFGGDLYTTDENKALNEYPVDMYTFNGHKAALADPSIYGEAIRVMRGIEPAGGRGEIGGKVRFFFVTGGPNIGSNWHIIGTIFDQVYTGHPSTPIRNEETVYVAPGSAAVFELTALVPGKYLLVDHALFRVPKGAAGFLWVDPQCHDVNTCAWPKDIFSPPTTGTGH